MEIQVFTPPSADESDVLEFGLVALTEAIAQLDEDALSRGFLGGEFGYGARWENSVFMMRPYCWCERTDCLWCTVWLSNETDCTEAEAQTHHSAQIKMIESVYGAGATQAPNFWHKQTGLRANWYKWIGRDMEVENPNAADVAEVFRECLASLTQRREQA